MYRIFNDFGISFSNFLWFFTQAFYIRFKEFFKYFFELKFDDKGCFKIFSCLLRFIICYVLKAKICNIVCELL